jgi:hypothetical protein
MEGGCVYHVVFVTVAAASSAVAAGVSYTPACVRRREGEIWVRMLCKKESAVNCEANTDGWQGKASNPSEKPTLPQPWRPSNRAAVAYRSTMRMKLGARGTPCHPKQSKESNPSKQENATHASTKQTRQRAWVYRCRAGDAPRATTSASASQERATIVPGCSARVRLRRNKWGGRVVGHLRDNARGVSSPLCFAVYFSD